MRFILILCALFSGAVWAEQPPFAAEDVFLLNYASDPQVSRDGEFVVYVHNFMDVMEDRRRSNLWRVDSDGGNNTRLVSLEGFTRRDSNYGVRNGVVFYNHADNSHEEVWVAVLDNASQTP